MKDVLKVFNASDAQKFTVAGFATIWIENKGNFNFEIHALPAEAQLSTVYGIVAGDFNADGNIDIALNGNEYSMAPVPFRTMRFMACCSPAMALVTSNLCRPCKAVCIFREMAKHCCNCLLVTLWRLWHPRTKGRCWFW